MALSQDIIEKAVAILQKNRVAPGAGLKEIQIVLEDFADSREIYDDDFTDLCERAKAALSTTLRPQAPAPTSGNRQGARSNGGARAAADASDIRAPFRFVQVNASVTPAQDKAADFGINRPLPAGFCGRILVDWAVETPLLIGERDAGNVECPLKLGEIAAIPGATLRGMMRSAAENIARGRLFQVNRHHRYGVRDFDHFLFASDREVVKGGWLRREKAPPEKAAQGQEFSYFIKPCEIKTIRIRDLPRRGKADPGRFHLEWLRKTLNDRYLDLGQATRAGKLMHYDFSKRRKFSLLPNENCVPDPNGSLQGLIICSNASPSLTGNDDELIRNLNAQDTTSGEGQYKKRETVFLDSDAEEVEIDPLAFKNFELAYTVPSKNKREATGTYAFLEPMFKAFQSIPIFYIGELTDDASKLTFGLTRLFKRSHLNSVGDLLARNHRAHGLGDARGFQPDLIENLFGYVFEKDELGLPADDNTPPSDLALKGRVAFGFAMLQEWQKARETEQITTIMSGPRASFGPFYLRGRTKDWSSNEAMLAGRKIYFPRFPVNDAQSRKLARESVCKTSGDRLFKRDKDGAILNGQVLGTEALQTKMKFLQPRNDGDDLVFRGEIRLHNVSAVEIGLLLWTLMHGGDPKKPYRHMIGRAKSAGAGQTRVKALRLSLAGNDAAADEIIASQASQPAAWEKASAEAEGWLMDGSLSTAPFLRAFDKAMGAQWRADPTLLEFLGASRPSEGERLRKAHADEYLLLSRHNELKRASKRMGGPNAKEPAPGQPAHLAAPALPLAQLRRPYDS